RVRITRSSAARLSGGPWVVCGGLDSWGRARGRCTSRVCCPADRLFGIRRVVSLVLHMCVELGAIESDHAIAPGLFRYVECVVRRLQQRFLVLHAWVGRASHAAAHGPAERSAGICKSMMLH